MHAWITEQVSWSCSTFGYISAAGPLYCKYLYNSYRVVMRHASVLTLAVRQLYLDIDGKGFQLEKTYDTKPQPAVVSFTAQNKIREVQQQQRVTLQEKRVVAKDHGVEDDDDFDWDTINDDLEEGEEPFVIPPMPTDDEINARLRDD